MPNFQSRATAHQSKIEFAEAWLRARYISFTKPQPYQLKIEQVNFWPSKGTIFVDGEPYGRTETGLAAFEEVLREFGLLPARAAMVSASIPGEITFSDLH